MQDSNKIKVLIVDDSALVRQTLERILKDDPEIEVIGTASDPYIAVSKIKKNCPDVITLDVEMPRMDGLTFLKKIMSQHPISVIIISTLTAKGTETALRALELGAVEIIAKPKLNTKEFIEEAKIKICDAIKAASMVRVNRKTFPAFHVEPKHNADVVIPNTGSKSLIKTTDSIIAVGASTGGTDAIKTLLSGMAVDCPGILIVQHMPEVFTKQFAKRLNEICAITVKESENGDSVLPGQALIAPGHSHMLLKRSGARYFVEIKDGELVNRHKPSVDVLFRSVAKYAGRNAVGILMTGMGADGAKGLLEMKQSGAYTVAQDEKTSVVFGMPKEAIQINAVDRILPLEQIAPHVQRKLLENKE